MNHTNVEDWKESYFEALDQGESYHRWIEKLYQDEEILEVIPPTEEEIRGKFGDDYL